MWNNTCEVVPKFKPAILYFDTSTETNKPVITSRQNYNKHIIYDKLNMLIMIPEINNGYIIEQLKNSC